MRNITKNILVVILSLIYTSATCLFLMGAIYYRADETAISEAKKSNVSYVQGDYLIKGNNNNTCIIFYPGAMVESKAYIPLAQKLVTVNLDTYIITMPLNYAFFNPNGADYVIEHYPNYSSFYLMGHSLGGSIASQYAHDHGNKIDGLILLGANPYKEYPLEKTCTIYGSLDRIMNGVISYTTNATKIEGGNHCYFGNYGQQLFDPIAKISRDQQQNQTVEAIQKFINLD